MEKDELEKEILSLVKKKKKETDSSSETGRHSDR